MGVTHVLNAAHGTAYSHGGQDYYGATIDYYGVPAHDLPSFDISQFFFSAAEFIHKALNTPGGMEWSLFTFVCVLAASCNQSGPWAQWWTGQYTAYCQYLHGAGMGSCAVQVHSYSLFPKEQGRQWKVDVRKGWALAERDRSREERSYNRERNIRRERPVLGEEKTCIWHGSSLFWPGLLTPSRGNCVCHDKWIGKWKVLISPATIHVKRPTHCGWSSCENKASRAVLPGRRFTCTQGNLQCVAQKTACLGTGVAKH